ncbi:hypothetical protein J437_LFUL011943 [Ladona fulva]|uniref:Uncharacterized protein n=1 Tax=Ladona fulva TaxID=123851 RepID=A0A8K0K171_LADFU|nr:hypothetical protein J437_LFUL011943 [Ladona fulva]
MIGMPSNKKEGDLNYGDYPNRSVPLEVICNVRYAEAKRKYRNQFRKDIEEFSRLQPNALAAVRLQRMFCVGMKIPKLENYFSPEEERRLEKILNGSNPQ